MLNRFLLIVMFALFCLLAGREAWAITPAGTMIIAQAEATFFDTETATPVFITSNQSWIRVGEVQALRLEHSQSLNGTAGQQVYFVHLLTNLGNVADSYQLSLTPAKGSSLTNLQIFEYHGAIPTPDAQPLTKTGILAPGEAMQVIVLATIPANDRDGKNSLITLQARSTQNNAIGQSVENTVIVGKVAARLSVTVNHETIRPEGFLRYDISFQNLSNTPLPHGTTTIDGKIFHGVLLENILPSQTLLDYTVPDFAPYQAIPVLRMEDGTWQKFENWDRRLKPTRIGLMIPAAQLQPGQSGRLAFSVRVNENASNGKRIVNIARLYNKLDEETVKNRDALVTSNPAYTTVKVDEVINPQAILRFVEAASFSTPPTFHGEFNLAGYYHLLAADLSNTADDVYIELEGGNFATSGESVDIIDTLTIRSGRGDRVRVRLQETGVDTGVFRSQSPLRLTTEQRANNSLCLGFEQSRRRSVLTPDYSQPGADCYLQSGDNDTITASIQDPVSQQKIIASADVSPQGIVFRTDNLAGLPGAKVAFTDMQGIEVSRTQTISNTNGQFLYPRLAPGHYFIKVTPPSNYQFPSRVPPSSLPGKKVMEASYGNPEYYPRASTRGGISVRGALTVNNFGQIERFDIPVDPLAGSNSGLLIEKEASQPSVAPGERIRYDITLNNQSDSSLFHLSVVDTLPHGFKYVAGTTRINGDKADDPQGGAGPQLTFFPPTSPPLASDGKLEISYVLHVGAGAIDSDGMNRATATARTDGSGQLITSNEAKAQVTVRMEGVLSDKAIVFGKVFVEGQCKGSTQMGIGGVRLYMEDGTWATTDENGLYSLMGLNAGNHVIKVDPVTLPNGLVLKPLDNRNAGDGNSRFADLTSGEMHRADFAARCPTTDNIAIFEQIKARNESINGDWLLDDAAKYNRSKPSESADSNGDLSNGVIRAVEAERSEANQPDTRQNLDTEKKTATGENDAKKVGVKIPLPKEEIKNVTRQQANKGTFLWPLGTNADGRFMAVVRAGVQPTLYINGKAVAHDRLGEQLINNREQAQLMAWYGVALDEGDNQVEIKASDMFGNERLLAGKTFQHAGTASSIVLTPSAKVLAADDGRSLLPITIKLLDDHGLPARGIYFVTLESTGGRWHEADIQDRESGHQIRIDNGEAKINLRSGKETGPITLKATTGTLAGEATITQVTPSRPLMAVGLIDINSGALPDLLSAAGEERDTRARTAMFIKGDIAEEVQLTLSYDSDKDNDTELFRDVDPDDYYPITGDASEKGYEAQSRSKLYAKIEHGLSSIMWGDYQTDSQSSEYDLAKSQRTLNGLNAIYDNGETRIQTFAARPENNLRTEVLEPNGTAMNYRLNGAPIVRHSETVTLEVWSRDNPGLMIGSTTLSRGSDYTLDEFSGYLKFTTPIQSRDSEGNPQKIRVSYELDGNGEAYTVAGARIQQKLGERVTAGISYSHDDHETEGSEIGGIWVEYKPTDKTTIAISRAHMTGKTIDDDNKTVILNQSGSATRIHARQQWTGNKWAGKGETEITWAKADSHFTNSSGGVSGGREETSLKHKQALGSGLDVRAEAEVSRTEESNNSQGDSVGVYLDKSIGDGWQLTAGSRYIRQHNDDDQSTYATGQAGVKKRFKLLNREVSISGEYEQAFSDNRWRTAIESDWQVHEKVSLYGRFERDNDLSPTAGDAERNEFSFGVKSNWLPNTDTYSEYRMSGATDGDQLEWVNGIDSRLEVSKGLSLSPAIEWVNTISGDNSNDGLALSLGIDDKRHKNQRATGRIEYRYGEQQDYYGLDGAVARRFTLDWAGLVREEFRLEKPKDEDGSKRIEHALTLGLAHRPKLTNVQHGLYFYQWKEERDGSDSSDESDTNRTVHLLSTHQNRKIGADVTLSARLGTKWVTDQFDDDAFDSQVTVFDSRLTWDLNHHWDLDLRVGLLSVDGDDSLRWSAGAGLSYLFARNLRAGVYYNVKGFRDDDLDSQKYNAEGVHLNLMFKFDESLFDWFQS